MNLLSELMVARMELRRERQWRDFILPTERRKRIRALEAAQEMIGSRQQDADLSTLLSTWAADESDTRRARALREAADILTPRFAP